MDKNRDMLWTKAVFGFLVLRTKAVQILTFNSKVGLNGQDAQKNVSIRLQFFHINFEIGNYSLNILGREVMTTGANFTSPGSFL